jgi:CRP-like cAMP-binding protein
MPDFAVEKLARYHPLTPQAIADMKAMIEQPVAMKHGTEIMRDGDDPRRGTIFVILKGWACRYIIMPGGDRQITGLLTAGDFTDTRTIKLAVSNFGVMTLTDATVARISSARFKGVLDRHRDLVLAFAKAQLAEESIMQTWIANMARKSARERMAHLLCEIVSRVSAYSEDLRLMVKLPFAQADLADLLGLSPVHVNRTIQAMRAEGLIQLRSKWLEISDYNRLVSIAEFDPSYLHYGEASRQPELAA